MTVLPEPLVQGSLCAVWRTLKKWAECSALCVKHCGLHIVLRIDHNSHYITAMTCTRHLWEKDRQSTEGDLEKNSEEGMDIMDTNMNTGWPFTWKAWKSQGITK